MYLGDRKTARADFTDRARRLASILAGLGVTPDSVVALLYRNDTAYLEAIEACRYVGAAYATVNWHSAPSEVVHILEDSGANVVIGHSDLTAALVGRLPTGVTVLATRTPPEITSAYGVASAVADGQLDLEGVLQDSTVIATEPLRFRGLMAYTSGSTGRPKGIRRTHDANRPDPFVIYAGLAVDLLQTKPGDRFYTSAPLYHSAPNSLSLFCLAVGNVDIFIAPKFDAETFLADVERFGITHTYIVPTMMIRLLKLPKDVRDRYDVSTLRYAISTGSAWPRDVKEAMIDWFGPIFFESYGASEIGFMTLISSPEALQKPGSVGKILPGGSIKILDDDMKELPVGEAGSIFVHLPMFGAFAYTNAEGNLENQRYENHATVGDVGYLDEEGYLFISDRKKDMIISGGANIFPAEIEAVLIDMPEILDCAVFGAPHAEFGEMIVAAVQPREGADVTLDTVNIFLAAKLARFKLPKKLDLHASLPREDSGKIFKKRLRDPYWKDSDRKI